MSTHIPAPRPYCTGGIVGYRRDPYAERSPNVHMVFCFTVPLITFFRPISFPYPEFVTISMKLFPIWEFHDQFINLLILLGTLHYQSVPKVGTIWDVAYLVVLVDS